jgi:hypothetical protein
MKFLESTVESFETDEQAFEAFEKIKVKDLFTGKNLNCTMNPSTRYNGTLLVAELVKFYTVDTKLKSTISERIFKMYENLGGVPVATDVDTSVVTSVLVDTPVVITTKDIPVPIGTQDSH